MKMKKMMMCSNKSNHKSVVLLVHVVLFIINLCNHKTWAIFWDNAVDLNEEFRLLWNVKGDEVIIEVQVATLGYVGIGFSETGAMDTADMAIGWVDQGQTYFQDRHVKKHSMDGEPVVDPSQDYFLLLGYENATHTVLRFKRKLDTCDSSHDIAITNDTMRVIFMYSEEEPRFGATSLGSLPRPMEAYHGYKSLYLLQRISHEQFFKFDPKLNIMELKNDDVELPTGDDTLYWCKVFKMGDFQKKQHLVRYEPIFDSDLSKQYMHHIMLYECQGSSDSLEKQSREKGFACFQPAHPKQCNAIVATWAKGSEGFTFPQEAGYPLDVNQARYYLMETHYNQVKGDGNGVDVIKSPPMVDSSGLRLFYTQALRKYDAGVLSIGIESNWRHIIPPGQERVISEGHCIDECTKRAFPPLGINIFGIMMRTHQIGKSVRLRHIRGREELNPVARDINTDSNYQEYRKLASPVRAMPGDRLIAECTYDSSSRKAITLGGMTIKEETCQVLTLYYPRQKELTTCHSLPSFPTVLHSLGIQELAMGSNPVLIAAPPDLAGMTLESRLVTYDWANQFRSFQKVTQRGSFKALCLGANKAPLSGTETVEAYSPNLSKLWRPPRTCSSLQNGLSLSRFDNNYNRFITESYESELDSPVVLNDNFGDDEDDEEDNNIIHGAARSKVSRSSATETMGLSHSSRQSSTLYYLTFLLPLIIQQLMAVSWS